MLQIELDHTSSGVQIAAALAKDKKTATVVNINGGQEKQDLYTQVYKATNKKLKKLGSNIKLDRKQVKKAVIATIYGGTHQTVYSSFSEATGLDLTEKTASFFQAFKETIEEQLSGVVTVQRYFEHIAQVIHKTGASSIEITLPSKGTFKVPFKETKSVTYRKTIQYTEVPCIYIKGKIDLEYSKGEDNYKGTAKTLVAGFIQSIDALLLSKVEAELLAAGVTFFPKHDAYLIEASNQGILLEKVQQAFFQTFQKDYLKDLKKEIEQKYQVSLKDFQGSGEYQISQVLKSNFLISQ